MYMYIVVTIINITRCSVCIRVCCVYMYVMMFAVYTQGEDDSGEEPMEEEEEEDGFFVPHGYLSEDEGDRSDAEGGLAGAEVS